MSEQISRPTDGIRYLVVMALVLGAFFGAYRYAVAQSAVDDTQYAAAGFGAVPGSAGGGCASCGSCSSAPTTDGVTGDRVEGTAVVEGDVQTIEVDQSVGYYQPNVIRLQAGVPAQITFGAGAGCTAQVMSQELDFYVDVTGGPQTVELPALEPGEYPFYCGMQMIFGKIVVE